MFPPELIERLKDNPANRLEDVLAEDNIKLTRKGRCSVGYHSNKHDSQSKTSLVVDEQQQLYYCFNCSDGGDVIQWLERNRDMTFVEACQFLAKRAGIELPGVDPESQKNYEQYRRERQELERLYNVAAECYHSQLCDRHYKLLVDKWGLTADTVKQRKIGYAPARRFIEKELLTHGFSRELIHRSGLLNKKHYDHFQGRLVFPYHKNRRTVYFIARKTDETPDVDWEQGKFKKLLTHNDKNPHVSKAVKNEYFAGEDTARGADELLITEGIADCYAAIQGGFACISPVTVRFRKADFPRLAMLAKRAKAVYLVNDNEENKAGEKGALATAQYLETQGIDVKLIELPRPANVDKVDLADYLREHPVDDLRQLIAGAKSLFDLSLDDLAGAPGDKLKRQVAINMVTQVSGIERDTRIEQVYQILKPLGVRKSTLHDEVTAIVERQAAAAKRKADRSKGDGQEVDPLDSTPKEVKDAALEILKSERLFDQISADITDIGIAGEEDLALMLYVIMTSRMLDKPLSAIVQGSSASGKSYLIETVAELMPIEALVQAHDFSDQALYYLPKGSLEHRIVISGERVQEHRSKDGCAQDNSKAFREMVASGELRKAVTVKGPDGVPKTVTIHQPGPIAYLESSTAAYIHDEDATRLLPLATDESPSQTRRIVESQKRRAKGQTISEALRLEIVSRHHTMQRLLKPVAVRIPYIDSISLPETNIATRRTFEQFVYAIKSVALLRQHQKPEDGADGYKEADETDYAIAYRLMKAVLARKYTSLNQQSRDLLKTILEHTETVASDGTSMQAQFTQKDCEKWTGLSNTTVRRRLSPLIWAGILEVDDTSKPYMYKVANPKLADVADLDLPSPEDIAERIAIMVS